MTPQDLARLEQAATPGPWNTTTDSKRLPDIFTVNTGVWNVATVNSLRDEYRKNAALIAALRNLAPHLIALWEAVEHDYSRYGSPPRTRDAISALNAAAKEMK